jgi:hypothetical protein
MRIPLKLNAIDQEHLQELYDASGVARDELPYTDKFEELWQGFQDRTFKNAQRDQVYGAILKYVRSSRNAPGEAIAPKLDDEQLKQLKHLLPRHAKGGKLLPYSDEFEDALKEFNRHAGLELTPQEFWQSIIRAQGPRRPPPKRAARAVAVAVGEDDDE